MSSITDNTSSFAQAANGALNTLGNAARNVWFNARPSNDVITSDVVFSRAMLLRNSTVLVAKQARDGSYDLQTRTAAHPHGTGEITTGLDINGVFNAFKEHNTVENDGSNQILETGEKIGNALPIHGPSNHLIGATEPNADLDNVPSNAIHYRNHPQFQGFNR